MPTNHNEPETIKTLPESDWILALSTAEIISEDCGDLIKELNTVADGLGASAKLQNSLREIQNNANTIAEVLEDAKEQFTPQQIGALGEKIVENQLKKFFPSIRVNHRGGIDLAEPLVEIKTRTNLLRWKNQARPDFNEVSNAPQDTLFAIISLSPETKKLEFGLMFFAKDALANQKEFFKPEQKSKSREKLMLLAANDICKNPEKYPVLYYTTEAELAKKIPKFISKHATMSVKTLYKAK